MDRKLNLLFYEAFTSKSLYPHVCLIPCCVRLFTTLWTVAYQAPLSLGFSRQEYWSGLPALLQAIFLTQGLNPCHLMSSALGGVFATSTTWEAHNILFM